MPVERFRSIDEMNRAVVPSTPEPDVERYFRHCARYWLMAPRIYPRGVFKFRTIEEAEHMSAQHRSVAGR